MRCLFLFALVLSLPSLAAARTLKVLSPNETIFLEVDPGASIEVSRSDVITVKDLGDRLQIRAKKMGTCTLQAGADSYLIEVVSTQAAQGYRSVHKSRYKGLKISPGKKGVVVTGKLLRLSDYRDLVESLPPGWSFQAEVPPDLQDEMTHWIQSRLQVLGQIQVPLHYDPAPLALLPPGAFTKMQPTLRRLGLAHLVSTAALEVEDTLPVTFLFAEISLQHLRDLGVEPPGATPLQVVPSLRGPDEVMVQVDHLAGRGLARKLAQPRLTLTSRKATKYHDGGEIPIRTRGFASADVQWKPYGLMLEVKPVFYQNHIKMDLKLELSSLDASTGSQEAPGIKRKGYESEIFIGKNSPAILLDVLGTQASEQTTGLPVLEKVPLLGGLFRTQKTLQQRSRSCLVILPGY